MESSSTLVGILSSSVSQLLLLLLLLSSSSSSSSTNSSAFSAVHHHLLSSHATLSLLLSSRRHKRRRLSLSPSPDSFPTHFRMTSSTFEWLCSLLDPLLDCRDPVASPLRLPAHLRLAIGLFRLSTGADHLAVSTHFRVSESAARFCSKHLCRVLCTNYKFWIEFPDNATHIRRVSDGFQSLSGLPSCCGAIQCARFSVFEREQVAAQVVGDGECRILGVVAGFKGSKSDETVLRSSSLYEDIESGELLSDTEEGVSRYLVGGGGYPLLPWLMVPFRKAMPGSDEERFNAAHSRMRRPGFRVVDSLRSWGVLSRPIHEEMKMAVAYIGACAILHNGLLMREDYSALSGELDDYSLYDESMGDFSDDACLEESSIERKKASVIRNALATKAKEFQESILSVNSCSLVSLQSTK